jgi:precorrin-6B methylase 2
VTSNVVRCLRASVAAIAVVTTASFTFAQQKPFTPEVGQPGKDVVWVPTPEEMVQKMMELGQVTPQDYVIDLGSGDGRNVIAAAKRGAQALGVEYNPDMVALSKRLATEAGVATKAQFVEGDMFKADFSKASVLALFLLPSNLLQLRPKFLELRPGSRIVSNTFSIQDWQADETVQLQDCTNWCTAMLYIVPAKVSGTWKLPQGELALKQDYQMLSGTLTNGGQSTAVTGRLRGTQITINAGGQEYTGSVRDNRMDGTVRAGSATTNWTATRTSN